MTRAAFLVLVSRYGGGMKEPFLLSHLFRYPSLTRIKIEDLAGPTRLELATSCVTGRRSNRLNYGPAVKILIWWAVSDLNGRPSGCKPDALTAELTALGF
jgi:hypothetical protein